jgi:hypothetical protein
MNLFWAIAGIVTAVRHFESTHRFKTLPPRAESPPDFREREVDLAGARMESFTLREIRHDVSLRSFATPMSLETSAV